MVIIVYFVVIALAFFLLIVLPQRRRATAHRALVESLGVGDEVVTIGGVFGTIREVDDDRIELEVAAGRADHGRPQRHRPGREPRPSGVTRPLARRAPRRQRHG